MSRLRQIATPMTIGTSLVVFLSGLWMFFIQKGKLLENIHSKVGLLFFIAAILHLIVNKSSFLNLIKSRRLYVISMITWLLGFGLVSLTLESDKGVSPGLLMRRLEAVSLHDLILVFKVDEQKVYARFEAQGLNLKDLETKSLDDAAKDGKKSPRELLALVLEK